jgi:hypothetical protein
MKMNKNLFYFLAPVAFSCMLNACGGNDDGDGDLGTADTVVKEVPVDTNRKNATRQIIYSIPSAAEMADILKDAGATYNFKILNDMKNADKYTTLKKQSINLGIYGADLNYANVFEKSMEVQLYMESCRALVKKLDIESAINEGIWERLEANKDDRDSLNIIISEVYLDLDIYLEENGNTELSGLMAAGGWIEGLYLAVMMCEDKKSSEVMKRRVAEQKYSLENLIKLMATYQVTETISEVKKDLDSLKSAFDKVSITREKAKVSSSADGVTIIGGESKVNMPDEVFTEIRDLAVKIRNSYVQP